jgi:hypothetical protein
MCTGQTITDDLQETAQRRSSGGLTGEALMRRVVVLQASVLFT